MVDDNVLPSHDLMPMYPSIEEDSLPQRLWVIAEKSEVRCQRLLNVEKY